MLDLHEEGRHNMESEEKEEGSLPPLDMYGEVGGQVWNAWDVASNQGHPWAVLVLALGTMEGMEGMLEKVEEMHLLDVPCLASQEAMHRGSLVGSPFLQWQQQQWRI